MALTARIENFKVCWRQLRFLNTLLSFLSILISSNRCDHTAYHDSFSQKMMLKMQAGLKDAKAKEDKAKATEESLQKAISDLKENLSAVNAASASSSAAAAATAAATAAETDQLVSSSATEKSQANEDAVMATAPIEGPEKNDIQVVEKAETQAQESSSNADPSTETSAPDTIKTTLNTEANSHAVVKAEVAQMSSDASAKQGGTIITDADVAASGKKKGRKRKANAPKKNAIPGSEVKIVEAAPPPQKKIATQAVAAKLETPPVTEAQPAVESIKVPPQQKTPTQAKTSSVTTTKPTAEIANASSQKEHEMKLKLEL